MLEIVFTSGRIGAKAIKLIGVAENARINSSFLSKEENSLLKKAALQSDFNGEFGTFAEVYSKNTKIIAIGLGKKIDCLSLKKAGALLAEKLFHDEVAVYFAEPLKNCKLTEAEIAKSLALGLQLGAYRFDKYFTSKKADEYPSLEQVIFKLKNPDKAREEYKNLAALANAVRYTKDLVNEPANFLTPEAFAADILRLKYLGLEVEVFEEEALQEKDFSLVRAVAKGSAQAPKVVVIKWKGNPKSDDWYLGLAGKGVTFDSGGLVIKSFAGMQNMKSDMAGAAVVVATLKALALQCCHKNIIGVIALVENMPGADAMKVGDVYASMSGQTVEIKNTDAEGRLLMADLLWYLQKEYDVKNIVDVTTLGGFHSVLRDKYAALFSNTEALQKALIAVGQKTGETLWAFPLDIFPDKALASNVADMVNSLGPSQLGSAVLAIAFLKRFIRKGTRWAHIEISNMKSDEKGMATGFGVELLNSFINEDL